MRKFLSTITLLTVATCSSYTSFPPPHLAPGHALCPLPQPLFQTTHTLVEMLMYLLIRD